MFFELERRGRSECYLQSCSYKKPFAKQEVKILLNY